MAQTIRTVHVLAGAEQAKNWFKSCEKGCKERFKKAVEDRCCASDHSSKKE